MIQNKLLGKRVLLSCFLFYRIFACNWSWTITHIRPRLQWMILLNALAGVDFEIVFSSVSCTQCIYFTIIIHICWICIKIFPVHLHVSDRNKNNIFRWSVRNIISYHIYAYYKVPRSCIIAGLLHDWLIFKNVDFCSYRLSAFSPFFSFSFSLCVYAKTNRRLQQVNIYWA